MINIINNNTITLYNDEYNIYSKQLILKEIGIAGQEKIKNTKVLVVGAGGLGCTIIMYLATSGIGMIGIIDGDKIDYSNLNRQILYDINDVKNFKATIAKKKFRPLIPTVG